jgi:endonuclease YncB( thermonuclease family)
MRYFFAVMAFVLTTNSPDKDVSVEYRAIDGVSVESSSGAVYRLSDVIGPELIAPLCRREMELGLRAKIRLDKILAAGKVRVFPTTTISDDGKAEAIITVDGHDVREMLIGEGHVKHSRYSGQDGAWCPPDRGQRFTRRYGR